MAADNDIIVDGEWSYRVNEDGTASIIAWLGDIYDPMGSEIVVPERFGDHPVSALIDDPIYAERIASQVDEGWIPPVYVASSPHSPARVWCAHHYAFSLRWEPGEFDPAQTCTYTVLDDGTARIDTWWSDDTELEIPASIDGHPVSRIGDGAFAFCEFESVTVPEGVIEIGDNAFECCENLESVTLPRGLARLGKSAFYECTELASVELGEGLTTLEPHVFAWCESLRDFAVPEGVRTIEPFAFEYSGLRRIELPTSLEAIRDPQGNTGIPEVEAFFTDCAFKGCLRDMRVVAPEDSYAYRWAEERGLLA